MTVAGRRFDDVLEGDELGPVALFLSKDQVRAYARAVDHYFPRFTDDEGARREGLPGMITPGNMSMGLLTTLVDGWAGLAAAPAWHHLPRTRPPDRTIRLCGA
jgi:acyl dehydratase